MAVSVNRQIEADLSNVMGQRDPEAMIRSRSTVPIRASGLVPREQAGHMTASGRQCRNAKKPLPTGGHPHMTLGSTVPQLAFLLGAKRRSNLVPDWHTARGSYSA